jgi:oligopeptide/dipeptide ABC transporter ATP-binding protein
VVAPLAEPGPTSVPTLLEVRDLGIAFPGADGAPVQVVRRVTLEVAPGEIVGLVGESGSGKSLTALAVLGLVPAPGRITGGSVRLAGRELVGAPERELRAVRGGRIGLVFQEPGAALNPVFSIGSQIAEAIRAHRSVTRREARRLAAELLARLALPDPERHLDEYPHQLSGGQRQRVVLALALAAGPELLIADEPTTALDVTIQAEVLELLGRLRAELGLAVLLITHDLAVVAGICDRVAVLYAGEVVEENRAELLFARPAHPYTRGLLAALPRLGAPAPRGELPTIPGQVPTPGDLPPGCPFHPRCPERLDECARLAPPWVGAEPERSGARCWAREREGRT